MDDGLISSLMNIKYDARFLGCVSGLIDSIYVFKKAFTAQSSYKQEGLARALLHIQCHGGRQDP